MTAHVSASAAQSSLQWAFQRGARARLAFQHEDIEGYSISDGRFGADSSRFKKVIIMVMRSSIGRKFKISCF
jgi:hypothetical protein